MKDYYAILEIRPPVTARALRAAYRKAAFAQHPDRNLERAAEAHEQFLDIQEAYAILSDPAAAQGYDQRWRECFAPKPQPVPPAPSTNRSARDSGARAGPFSRQPSFRRQAQLRKLSLQLAAADPAQRRRNALIRGASLCVSTVPIWIGLLASPVWFWLCVALSVWGSAMLWVLAWNLQSKQSEEFWEHAETLLRRREDWAAPDL